MVDGFFALFFVVCYGVGIISQSGDRYFFLCAVFVDVRDLFICKGFNINMGNTGVTPGSLFFRPEALYISWDGPAMETIEALTELGRTDIAISTGDLDYAVAMNMAKGGMIKVLSAQRPYEQGQAIALAAVKSILNEEVPSFVGIEPISVTPENLLRSWKQVFKEEANEELVQAFKENPNYVFEKIVL